jgi:uncharacterized protein (TIGR02996 family)
MLDTPDDNAARLILADWLQENGREGLAEQFRLADPQRVHEMRIARLSSATSIYAGWLSGPSTSIGNNNPLTRAIKILDEELS